MTERKSSSEVVAMVVDVPSKPTDTTAESSVLVPAFRLLALFDNLKVLILQMLPIQDHVYMSRVCKALAGVGRDVRSWTRVADFSRVAAPELLTMDAILKAVGPHTTVVRLPTAYVTSTNASIAKPMLLFCKFPSSIQDIKLNTADEIHSLHRESQYRQTHQGEVAPLVLHSLSCIYPWDFSAVHGTGIHESFTVFGNQLPLTSLHIIIKCSRHIPIRFLFFSYCISDGTTILPTRYGHRLRHLRIVATQVGSTFDLSGLSETAQALETLTLDTSLLQWSEKEVTIIGSLTNLTSLVLKGISFPGKLLSKWAKLQKLQTLSLPENNGIQCSHLVHLVPFKELHMLYVLFNGVDEEEKDQDSKCYIAKHLQQLPRLTILSITTAKLKRHLANLHELRNLRTLTLITWAHPPVDAITDDELANSLGNEMKLENASFIGPVPIGDRTMAALANCPLQSLMISSSVGKRDSVSSSSWVALSLPDKLAAKYLTRIDLCNVSLDEDAMKSIALLSHLRHLRMFNGSVSAKSVCQLADLPLVTLGVARCGLDGDITPLFVDGRPCKFEILELYASTLNPSFIPFLAKCPLKKMYLSEDTVPFEALKPLFTPRTSFCLHMDGSSLDQATRITTHNDMTYDEFVHKMKSTPGFVANYPPPPPLSDEEEELPPPEETGPGMM